MIGSAVFAQLTRDVTNRQIASGATCAAISRVYAQRRAMRPIIIELLSPSLKGLNSSARLQTLICCDRKKSASVAGGRVTMINPLQRTTKMPPCSKRQCFPNSVTVDDLSTCNILTFTVQQTSRHVASLRAGLTLIL